MGLMVVGAMGTGKTFLVRCFAKTAGLTAVVLKNFRDKWVGSTESNLEKVLSMIQAMGPVLLVIDEGDRSFGSGSEDSDGGTSSRVMARLKEFSSDTRNRGHVVTILMTNRPDRLDTDIKRAGRFDVKIPLFYPSAPEEVRSVVLALCKRHKITLTTTPADLLSCCALLQNYSNADIEAVLLLGRKLGRGTVDKEIFEQAARDYLPSRDAAMIEYMNLLAVFEASRRSWLPEKYGALTPEQLTDRLGEARRKCGLRAMG
jgi:SpoVK/Ycf46/Vps4 family AAA+-type ATPase